MIVKVCGLTPKTTLELLGELRVDWAGLIFVIASPRYVGKEVFSLPQNLKRVGVFRNDTAEEILSTAKNWNLQTIQLHGDESPDLCRRIRSAGLNVMKAIAAQEGAQLDALTAKYIDSVDYFLFDSPGGGTGRAFDWSILDSYTGQVPFLLAGGIAPGFGESIKAIKHLQFRGIDLNSGFEIAPGHKDVSLISKFLDHELPR